MSRYSKKQKPSPETRDEAIQIAKGTQRPGQTKEQTRLIAQGIQKGIDQYKKQQKAKKRELDKQLRAAKNEPGEDQVTETHEIVIYRQHWLPWVLLAISWIGFAFYIYGL